MLDAVDFRWDILGAKLATLGDDEQAQFFKGFARELNGYESHFRRECQMMACGDKLDARAKQTLEKYLPAMWFKEEPAGK